MSLLVWDPGISKVQSLWERAGLGLYSFAHSPNFWVCIYLSIQCISIHTYTYIYMCIFMCIHICVRVFVLRSKNGKETISLNLKIAQTSVTAFRFLEALRIRPATRQWLLAVKVHGRLKRSPFFWRNWSASSVQFLLEAILEKCFTAEFSQNGHDWHVNQGGPKKMVDLELGCNFQNQLAWHLKSNEMMWALGLVTCDKFVTDLAVATVSSTEDFGIFWCSCQEREPLMVEKSCSTWDFWHSRISHCPRPPSDATAISRRTPGEFRRPVKWGQGF